MKHFSLQKERGTGQRMKGNVNKMARIKCSVVASVGYESGANLGINTGLGSDPGQMPSGSHDAK